MEPGQWFAVVALNCNSRVKEVPNRGDPGIGFPFRFLAHLVPLEPSLTVSDFPGCTNTCEK